MHLNPPGTAKEEGTDCQYSNASDKKSNNYFWFKASYQNGASVVQKQTVQVVDKVLNCLKCFLFKNDDIGLRFSSTVV